MNTNTKPTIYVVKGIFGYKRQRLVTWLSKKLHEMSKQYFIVSSDDSRDELFKWGRNFSTLPNIIVKDIKYYLAEGKDVIFDADSSGLMKYFWLRYNFSSFANIKNLVVKQKKEDVFPLTICDVAPIKGSPTLVLPHYFKYSKNPFYESVPEGLERGIAVANDEIARHLKKYKTGPDGNLVYKNWL